MTSNPLVAAPAHTPPSAWAGVWICEDIELIAQGVRTGNWIDGSLGVVSAGLDALAFVTDPVGNLLQYGIAWLIEHVKPLSEALDWLAGDPAQITAHAQTWRNVAASLRDEAGASGERAPLRAVKDMKGGGHTGVMVGGMVATGILFFPAAPFFLFMHGKDVSIPKGTEVTAYVSEDMKLDLAKFQPAPVQEDFGPTNSGATNDRCRRSFSRRESDLSQNAD